MGKVISFPGVSYSPLVLDEEESNKPLLVEAVLFGAMEQPLEEVIVVGILDDGSLYLASNTNVLPKVNYLLDIAKSKVVNVYTNSPIED